MKAFGLYNTEKNRALHSGIKRSPYEAMFGSVPKTGLSSSLLPKHILRKMESEEEAVSQQTINSGQETETRLDNMVCHKKNQNNIFTIAYDKYSDKYAIRVLKFVLM